MELSDIPMFYALWFGAEGSQLENPAEYVKRINSLILDMGGRS